jgi:hypothetical protein
VSREESAEEYWRPLFTKYNQTLRGLKAAGHEVDDEEYVLMMVESWAFSVCDGYHIEGSDRVAH